MAPWAASALHVGLIYRPRITRVVASVLTGVLVSNVVNQGYAILRKRA